MRLVKVSAPQGKGPDVARIAFDCGIGDVSIHQASEHKPRTEPVLRDVLDAKVSTPQAKTFIDALVNSPLFNRHDYAIEVREPRSILKSAATRDITRPVPAAIPDIEQELWQFTHITYSFVLRVLIAALLIAYGMLNDNPLFMIGGLIFVPFMPLVLAFSFGALTRQWQLVRYAALAFMCATLLILAGAIAIAVVAAPPILFDKFPPIGAGLGFSLAIGVAAALGTADDAGHRQLVGLAAASQLAILPAWFGLSLVFGFASDISEKLAAFGINVAALVIGCIAVYAALSIGTRGRSPL